MFIIVYYLIFFDAQKQKDGEGQPGEVPTEWQTGLHAWQTGLHHANRIIG
jgi:hypothetical protein